MSVFETNRLIIRHLRFTDLEPFHEMQGNERVMRYTTGRAFTLAENREDLRQVIAYYGRPGNDFWVWAVERKSDGQLVGTCALIVNKQAEHEVGYRFLERFWGMGYGSETLSGLIEYATGPLALESLTAYVNRENVDSVRLLDKSLFNFVREFYNEEEKCVDRVYRYFP